VSNAGPYFLILFIMENFSNEAEIFRKDIVKIENFLERKFEKSIVLFKAL